MPKEQNPIELTIEELKNINPVEIGKGIPVTDNDVDAQCVTITCRKCGHRYWNNKDFRYTMCPECGSIIKWW